VRRRAKLAAALALALVTAGGALAYFQPSSTGTGKAGTATLNMPTNVRATVTPGSGTVPIGWTLSATGGGAIAPLGYYVTRTNEETSTTSPACGTSPASLVSSAGCNDTSVPDGTYSYTVVAELNSWTAASSPTDPVPVQTDITPPTTALSLVSPSHAFLSGSGPYTLYDKTNTAGSFRIADQVTDDKSGPASADFPGVATNGWTGHTASELVASGTGSVPTITYTSSATQLYSWNPGATNPSAQTVTAKDVAGNETSDTVDFVSDTTAPVNGALVVNGKAATARGSTSYSTTTSFTIGSRTDFTDAGSGIASSVLAVQSFALSNGRCGPAAGPFSAPAVVSGMTQPSGITGGFCYTYTLVGTDHVGNTASISTTVEDDTTTPAFTITARGAAVTTNGTNEVFFKAATGSSFTISATDPESGIASTTYPACPRGWTRWTGTNSVTCTDTCSAAAGSMSVSATNNAGSTANLTITITVDATGPTNDLSLTNQTGGSFIDSGTDTVYYRGAQAGSFTIRNALTDAGSGPASSTFGALGGSRNGWTFFGSSVSTPAGGPYTSSTVRWNAATTSSPTEAVRGADELGNTTRTKLAFTDDDVAPSGGSVSVPAFVDTTSVPVTFGAGTDAGSGVDAAGGQLSRASATYTSGPDTCGTFSSFTNVGSAGASSPYTDTSVSPDTCYEYRYTVSDNVGNSVTYTSSPVAVDTTAPSPLSLTFTDAGGGTAGTIEQGDVVTVAYSEQMSVKSFCSAWTGGDSDNAVLNGNDDVVVTVGDGGDSNDTLTVTSPTCTFDFGSIDLGSTAYVTGGNVTFGADGNSAASSSIVWTAGTHTLTITLGRQSSGTVENVSSAVAVYTPSSSLTDSAGNAITGTASTGNAQKATTEGLSSGRAVLLFAVLCGSGLGLVALLTMPIPRRRRARRRKER
jgi:hypothetical protein